MRIRPFRLFSESELAALACALAERAAGWRDEWAAGRALRADAAALSDRKLNPDLFGDGLLIRRGCGESMLIAAVTRPELCRLATEIYGGEAVGMEMNAVATSPLRLALRALMDRLLEAAEPSESPAAVEELNDLASPGSGAVRWQLQLGGAEMTLVGSAALASRLCPASAPAATATVPLMPVGGAVEAEPVRLRLWLTDVELDLATLGELAEGDVIAFGTPANAALELRTDEGAPVGAAYLGLKDGSPALQVFKK